MPDLTARYSCRPAAIYGLLVLGFVAAGCSKSETAQARTRDDAAKPVKVEPVREETVRRAVEVVGTLTAVDQAMVSAEADGAVSRIVHDLGDRVKAGDALIELDHEKQQYNLDQQKAALASALAQYGAADPEHLPPAEQVPDVRRADADLMQAKQAFDRATALFGRKLVPQQTLDDAEAALHSKQAARESSLQAARNLRANIGAVNATMKLAERQLRDTTIRAPFDGYVQQRMVNLGQLVKGSSAAPTAVMSIVRLDPLKVTAELPEKMGPWIEVGQPVELHVDAYPDKAIVGKMSRISPAVNTSTREFPFEALVPNGDALLKPGTFARVRVQTAKNDKVLTLPYAALQYRYGVNRAFVVQGDHLVAKELKVGERLGERVEIVAGISAGEPVAMTDVDKLVDGLKVSTK
jgi:multidrug efflux pump subunit AcrA (membrane-fusion protein)